MPKRHLITSALPYINGVKHLGNLVGSMLPADVYARYLRARDYEVLFICATDEHGTPAEISALEAGLGVDEYCRLQHKIQADVCRRFELSFDHFGRSSSRQNHQLTKHFARELEKRGFIEERPTRQVYSLEDRRFLPDRYITGTCPHCGYTSARGDQCESCTRVLDPTDLLEPRSAISGSTRLEIRETRHLFLLQSKLSLELRNWIERHGNWPRLTRSIALKWLDEGVQDRCITRDLSWGVPVERPGFENKVFYVWFDAPIEYIGATEEWADADPANRDWKSWWYGANDVHYTQFMAKDNIPFHTIVFPAMILGTREPWKLADFIMGFNWLTYEGGKFSTSGKRGVLMSDALEILPADYWRYWLLANAPESNDSDFAWELFAGTVNKDLVGVFGNFVNRILRFAISRFDGVLPSGGTIGSAEERLFSDLSARLTALEQHLTECSFRKAVQDLRGMWVSGNTYLDNAAPWKAIQSDPARAMTAVQISVNLVRFFGVISEPVLPGSSRRIAVALKCTADEWRWPSRPLVDELAVLTPGRPLEAPDLLFRRIEEGEVRAWSQQYAGQPKTP